MMAKYAFEFEKCGVKLLSLPCDDIDSHKKWTKDIEAYASDGCKVNYPIVADPKRELIKKLNMVDPDEHDDQRQLTLPRPSHCWPGQKGEIELPLSCNHVKKHGPSAEGVESLLLATKAKAATPVNWKFGNKVVISASVSIAEAKKKFLEGFEAVDLPSK